MKPIFWLALIVTVSLSYRTMGQEASAPPAAGTYMSEVDKLLSIDRISVLPFTDNLQGIYARPLEAHFISLVSQMHRWDYVPSNSSGPMVSPDELESSSEKALQVSQGLNVDGFFVARVTKGPNGVMIHLSLFFTKDGKLMAQAVLKDHKQFDIENLKIQISKLLNEIVGRIPYAGRVLSREGTRVTVNLGARDGLQPGQMLNVIQLIQLSRHPKFNFLVKVEKEIFGKIKVIKVDDTLSFGMVAAERDKGSVQKNSKVGTISFVTYDSGNSLSLAPTAEDALSQRDDGAIAFGKDARPWQPQNPPSVGAVGGLLGVTRYTYNRQSSDSAIGAVEGADSFAPGVTLLGELWITQEWTFHAKLRQAVMSVKNPKSSSTPTELNQSVNYYEAGAGYTFRMGPHIWSPFVEPYAGMFSYRLYTDNSDPTVFTTLKFSGLKFGVRGAVPLGNRNLYGGGGDFSLAFRPGLKESPKPSSDSNEASVIQFGIFGYRRMGERLKAQAALDFEMYSASFSTPSGSNPATSASQRHTTLSGGLIYMF